MPLFADVVRVARRVPGVTLAERALGAVERPLMRELKHRLELISPGEGAAALAAAPDRDRPVPALPERMQLLLRRSMDQTPSDSQRSLFEHVLGELVPDEARILAALADGSRYALIDVAAAGRRGTTRPVLQNASSVGRAAGVAVPALVPTYVTHLLALGLAETDREHPGLEDEYEILLTETDVQSARDEGARAGRRSARIVRRTLRISALGREFWAACQPRQDEQ
jgi:hypothetical protein